MHAGRGGSMTLDTVSAAVIGDQRSGVVHGRYTLAIRAGEQDRVIGRGRRELMTGDTCIMDLRIVGSDRRQTAYSSRSQGVAGVTV